MFLPSETGFWIPSAARVLALISCAFLFACSNGNSSTAAEQRPAFSVLEVFPPDGALGVLWRSQVRVKFSEPVLGLGLEDLTVEDGVGPLGGYLEASIDGRTWTWQPVRDLPRGGHLEVRLSPDVRAESGARPASSRIASYRVVDHINQDEHWLGSTMGEAIAAMVWPNGRLAVAVGRDVHDLTQGPVVTTSLPLVGRVESCVADEIGLYTAVARDGYVPFVLEAAHEMGLGNVSPSVVLSSPAAFGRFEHVGNARGDSAVYSYGILASEAHEGLFHSRTGSASWSEFPLSEAGPFAVRRIALDGSGNIFIGFFDASTGRLRLQRVELASGASREFDIAGAPDDFRVGARGDGEAKVFWRTRTGSGSTVRHQRYVRRFRDGALGAPELLYEGEEFEDLAFRTASGGAAVAVFANVANGHWYLQRFEADGEVGLPSRVVAWPPQQPFALAMTPRGAAWFVWVLPAVTGDEIYAVRSWPGRQPEAPQELYRVPASGVRVNQLAVAVEDGGRVVVAFTEDGVGPVHYVKAITLR